MEKCRFHLQILDLIRLNYIFVISIKFWVRQSGLKQNTTNWGSCKNGKKEKCRFHPQLLDFGQKESHSRDSHQILGTTVVFKARSEKFGKLQKWESADFTLNYWILIRKNHILVIFIKFQVRRSCLKQERTNWESCKKWKKWKMPISPSTIGFWSR